MSAHKGISLDTQTDLSDLTVTIELDDGSEMDCQALTIFDVGDQFYIVLLPIDDKGQPMQDQVYIYRYYEDEKKEHYLGNIETDEEYDRVSKRFDEIQEQL